MPVADPPVRFDGQPNRYVLRRGTCLWRVHCRPYSARSFKTPFPAAPPAVRRHDDEGGVPIGGARFDATDTEPYPYSYLALDETTALAETLLRNLRPDEEGRRLVLRRAVAGRQLSGLTLTRDLQLVRLISGEDLAAIGQDAWLVTAPAPDYPHTRRWGHWLRRQAKWAHGLIWPSLRNPGSMAIVLFGDRCAADFGRGYERVLLHEVVELTVDLDDEPGVVWLNGILGPHRAAVAPVS